MVGGGSIFIGLGSNQGDRDFHIRTALTELASRGDVRVVRQSSLHETEPVGGPAGQGPYLNAVAEIDTDLPARALLERMLQIEARHGRERRVPNGPRPLDLDLLLYRDQLIDEPDLKVPHPRMWQRAFVTEPLAEVLAGRASPEFPRAANAADAGGPCDVH